MAVNLCKGNACVGMHAQKNLTLSTSSLQFYFEAKISQFFRVAPAAERSMMAALWQSVQVQARHVKPTGNALCKK